DFGQVIVGQTVSAGFQVVNAGGLDLSGNITTTSPFAIPDPGFILPPGGTGYVEVTFSPTSAGNISNVVVFTSNGGNSTNTVTGIGLTPPQLAVSPSSIEFGTVSVGANAQASFTLTNLGGGPLDNGTISVTSGAFSI